MARTRRGTMTKWEYCRLALIRKETDDNIIAIVSLEYFQNPAETEFAPIEADPDPLSNDQATSDAMFTLDKSVARLGVEGWEAIAIEDQGLRWYFKRPLAQ
jgi:hypothetical protein